MLFLEGDIALALESLRSIGPLYSFGLDIRLFEQARRREPKGQYFFPCLAIPRALAERFLVQVVEKRIEVLHLFRRDRRCSRRKRHVKLMHLIAIAHVDAAVYQDIAFLKARRTQIAERPF